MENLCIGSRRRHPLERDDPERVPDLGGLQDRGRLCRAYRRIDVERDCLVGPEIAEPERKGANRAQAWRRQAHRHQGVEALRVEAGRRGVEPMRQFAQIAQRFLLDVGMLAEDDVALRDRQPVHVHIGLGREPPRRRPKKCRIGPRTRRMNRVCGKTRHDHQDDRG